MEQRLELCEVPHTAEKFIRRGAARSASRITAAGIVNLDGRGMLVVSVARRLGPEVRLLADYATRFKPSGGAKRRPGSAKLTMPSWTSVTTNSPRAAP
jgi:hypothetical protein